MPIVNVFDPYTGGAIGGGGGGGGGGTGPGAEWLDIPTTVINVSAVPSPLPGSVQWPAPNNGTGPFVYEVTFLTGNTTNQIFDYDLATRTLYYTQATNATNDSTKNSFVRIKATDANGNYGYGYILFWRNGAASAANHFVLPEIVLAENDPAPTYTFAPIVAGAVGRINSDTGWSHTYGNGKLSENPMYLNDAAAGGGPGISRYMGPFTVDPMAGSVIIMTTTQQDAPGTTIYAIAQPFRRRRADSYNTGGPYFTLLDYDMQALGAGDPSAFTIPLTGTQNHNVDFAPAPGETDFFQLQAAQITAGSAATVEVAKIDADGLTLELQTAALNNRSIRATTTSYTWPTDTNIATRRPNRVYLASTDCEIVWRWHGRIEIDNSGGAGTGGGRVDWANAESQVAGGGGGLSFYVYQTVGGPVGYSANTMVQLSAFNASTPATVGFVPAAEVLGRDIGVDVIGVGADRVTYIYQWTGAFPDLTAARPYDGYKYWVVEGDAESSAQGSFNAGSNLRPFINNGYASGAAPTVSMFSAVYLNGNANTRVFSRIYRQVVMARPRPLQLTFR